MSYKLNIRNSGGGWDNLLLAEYVEILDTNNKFTETYVEGALEELFDNSAHRTEHFLAPTINDDNTAGYRTGDIWVDTLNDETYICLDSTTGAAVWTRTTRLTDEEVKNVVGEMVSGSNVENGITVTYDAINHEFDFTVDTATYSTLGVASFDSSFFVVTAGAVSIADNSIDTLQLAPSAVTVTELAGNIDATGIGFDADMVDGRNVNDTVTDTNTLWTSQKISDYVSNVANGLYWQDPVISTESEAPTALSAGDRYVVGDPASGVWTGHENDIAEWNGSSWDYYTPTEGYALWNDTLDVQTVFDGTDWLRLGSTLDHGNLQGIGDDDHTQYVHISTARTITAQHTFAPSVAQAPFVLNTNAQGQLVTGLNTDLLNGQDWTITETEGEPVVTQTNDIWVEITYDFDPLLNYTVDDNGDKITTDNDDYIYVE